MDASTIRVGSRRWGLLEDEHRTGRVLVALEPMRNDPNPQELIFLGRAWKAAFAKAQSLGWLT